MTTDYYQLIISFLPSSTLQVNPVFPSELEADHVKMHEFIFQGMVSSQITGLDTGNFMEGIWPLHLRECEDPHFVKHPVFVLNLDDQTVVLHDELKVPQLAFPPKLKERLKKAFYRYTDAIVPPVKWRQSPVSDSNPADAGTETTPPGSLPAGSGALPTDRRTSSTSVYGSSSRHAGSLYKRQQDRLMATVDASDSEDDMGEDSLQLNLLLDLTYSSEDGSSGEGGGGDSAKHRRNTFRDQPCQAQFLEQPKCEGNPVGLRKAPKCEGRMSYDADVRLRRACLSVYVLLFQHYGEFLRPHGNNAHQLKSNNDKKDDISASDKEPTSAVVMNNADGDFSSGSSCYSDAGAWHDGSRSFDFFMPVRMLESCLFPPQHTHSRPSRSSPRKTNSPASETYQRSVKAMNIISEAEYAPLKRLYKPYFDTPNFLGEVHPTYYRFLAHACASGSFHDVVKMRIAMRCLKLNSLGATTSEEKRFYKWAIQDRLDSTVSAMDAHLPKFYQGMEYDVFEAWVERRMQKQASLLQDLKKHVSEQEWDADMLVSFAKNGGRSMRVDLYNVKLTKTGKLCFYRHDVELFTQYFEQRKQKQRLDKRERSGRKLTTEEKGHRVQLIKKMESTHKKMLKKRRLFVDYDLSKHKDLQFNIPDGTTLPPTFEGAVPEILKRRVRNGECGLYPFQIIIPDGSGTKSNKKQITVTLCAFHDDIRRTALRCYKAMAFDAERLTQLVNHYFEGDVFESSDVMKQQRLLDAQNASSLVRGRKKITNERVGLKEKDNQEKCRKEKGRNEKSREGSTSYNQDATQFQPIAIQKQLCLI
jgi:hypothetical protein